MKKLILGICLLFIALLSNAQFVGTVTNQNNEPIPFASIQLPQNIFISANANGYFRFSSNSDSVRIHITAVGYNPYSTTLKKQTTPHVIQLTERAGYMEPIEVKAIRAGEKMPFTQSKLTAKDLEKNLNGQDLPFLLQNTPSLVANSDAGNAVGYTGMRIRGTDGTRINITLNGIPYNDQESQGAFFVNLPDFASSLEDVQIQRGVGTSSNGAAAFGASINLNTNGVKDSAYAHINNSIGSFNTRKHTIKAGSGLIDDHFTVDVRLSKVSSDGYVDRASTDLKSFYLSGAWMNEKSSVRLNVFSGKERTYLAWNGVAEDKLKTDRTYNVSGTERPGSPYPNETDNYQQDHFQLFFNHDLGKQWKFNTALFWTIGKGYYEEYRARQKYAEDYGLPEPTIGGVTFERGDMIRQLWLDNDYYGQVFSIQKSNQQNEFTFGGGWNRYEGHHIGRIIWSEHGIQDGTEWYRLPAHKNDVNFYAKYLRTIDRWNLFADVQYRNVHYAIYGYRKAPSVNHLNTWNFVNPKIGVSYIVNDLTAYASFAISNREPNRDDFEVKPSEKPKHEQLQNIELGVKKGNAQLGGGINFYYMNYKDQLILTGKVNDVGAYARTNVDKSYRMGVELEGNVQLSSWAYLSANLAWSKNRIKSFTAFYDNYDNDDQISEDFSNTPIAFAPKWVGGYNLRITPFNAFNIHLLGKFVDRQFLDNTGNKNRSINGFYNQNIQLSYDLKKVVFKESQLVFQVNNVFNKMYESNGYTFSYLAGGEFYTENYYYPMAGTNWMLSLNIKL
ncbi:TonB-dependent receptor [Gynurincola endophyticus]|uniref:TonB-dependent receptor n=1 Tax=Gynurincola endophyticus TaxID=2479004 RepID=UPI000F8D7C5E|nr:TonB-dependent receptor plug domain-containing protein [Gynurincola endophyticus]